jgi:hypothetical protein
VRVAVTDGRSSGNPLARTLYPDISYGKIVLSFSSTNVLLIPPPNVELGGAETTASVELPVGGPWTIKAQAYAGTVPVVEGEATVTISNIPQDVTLILSKPAAGGNGTLSYSVTWSGLAVNSARLTLSPADGSGTPIDTDITAAGTGTISCAPGYYILKTELNAGTPAKTVVRTETAHIYAEQTTQAVYVFGKADFEGLTLSGTVTAAVETGLSPFAEAYIAAYIDAEYQNKIGAGKITGGTWTIQAASFHEAPVIYFRVETSENAGGYDNGEIRRLKAAGQIDAPLDSVEGIALGNIVMGPLDVAPPEGGRVVGISTQEELAAINDHIGSAEWSYGKNIYVLLNDIALTGDWTPIGNIPRTVVPVDTADISKAFQGYFFGNNHRITGLVFSEGDSTHTGRGLFGALYKAVIQNLYVETNTINITITNQYPLIGILAGYADDSDLETITVKTTGFAVDMAGSSTTPYLGGALGCVLNSRLKGITVTPAAGAALTVSVSGSISFGFIGGIAGSAWSDTSSENLLCSLPINVSSQVSGASIGGIMGNNDGTAAVIQKSGYFGALTAAGSTSTLHIGGITGRGNIIEECYVMADINVPNSAGDLYAGGITGSATLVSNCYAFTRMDAASTATMVCVGGIVGDTGSSSSVEKSYAAGSLQLSGNSATSSPFPLGGIIGGGRSASWSLTATSYCASLMESLTTSSGILAGRISMRRNSDGSPYTDTGNRFQNNIAFNNMLVNGLTLSDAATDPQNDANGLGKTAAQLKTQATYETGLGWDFATVWEMGPAAYPYPILKWQNGAVPVPTEFEPLPDAPPRFDAGVSISFGEEISLSTTGVTIYKNSTPRRVTLTASAGYDSYRWYTDGMLYLFSQSIDLHASEYDVGDHNITVIVYRDTVPYSKSIVITVSGE